MGIPAIGTVVIVPFPFTDLSRAKLRPAGLLADVGRGDWLLCQITSNAYADPLAVEIKSAHFAKGALRLTSYARPGKLFTANSTLIHSTVGQLKDEQFALILNKVIELLQRNLPAQN